MLLRLPKWLGLSLLLLVFSSGELLAATGNRQQILQEQRQVLTKEIAAAERKVRAEIRQRNHAIGELEAIEKQLAELEAQRVDLSKTDKAISKSLAGLGVKRKTFSTDIAVQKDMLARLLREAYMAGQQEKLALLLNQNSADKLGRIMDYQDYISQRRVKHINQLVSQQNQLEEVEAQLTQAKTESEQTKKELKTTLGGLQRQKKQRASLVQQLNDNVAAQERKLDEYRQQEEQLQVLMQSIQKAVAATRNKKSIAQKTKFSKLLGKLHWPVKGKNLNRYNDARASGRLRWQGIMIEAKRGTNVRSIAPGQVVFAGWMGRLGLLIAVDHGQDYISVYAHNETLYKAVGDWVVEQELIAAVGDSGGQDKTASYFALRKKERYRNPARWCKKPAKP